VTENRLLEREYQILKSIYAYYDIYPESESKPVPDRSSSPTRLSRDLILEQLVVKRIPYPLSLQKLENRNALLFKDTKFGPIDLGGEAAVDIMNGVRIGLYITQALDILHKAKFIHLNVCPETILAKYSCDNEVEDAMLFDYRIAIEMGKDVELPGTIDENTKYISPEQTGRLDKMIDTRSDIYSLGITLWELIVGKHPFEDVAEDEMVYSHIAKEIEPAHKANPLIPPIISEIVAKMIKKDATERYQTVGAVYHDLERVLNHYKSLPSDANFLVEMSKIQLEIGSKDYHREIRMNGLVCGFENLISEFGVILKDLKSRPSEVVFLKGGAKSGKMTLVQQVLKVVNQANGHLCNSL
jgi:serine/threonine protein kinase